MATAASTISLSFLRWSGCRYASAGVNMPRPRVSRASAQLKHSPELASCSGQLQKPQPGNGNPQNKAENTHGNMRGAAWRPCRSDTCRVQKARHSQCSQRPTAVDKRPWAWAFQCDKRQGLGHDFTVSSQLHGCVAERVAILRIPTRLRPPAPISEIEFSWACWTASSTTSLSA